jgi:hypothetical protein
MTQETERQFIGSEKHITFGGTQSGGVNIPGGLRAAQPVPHVANGHRRQPVPAPRVAPATIGAETHITFGGTQAGGVNIPAGLRMPAPASHH